MRGRFKLKIKFFLNLTEEKVIEGIGKPLEKWFYTTKTLTQIIPLRYWKRWGWWAPDNSLIMFPDLGWSQWDPVMRDSNVRALAPPSAQLWAPVVVSRRSPLTSSRRWLARSGRARRGGWGAGHGFVAPGPWAGLFPDQSRRMVRERQAAV